jgi:hypothetical protein
VTINAPIEKVWPWLAQLGQDRGGYSYEWLENLAGCEMKNADRIHTQWQHRELGETVHLHPAGGMRVNVFEPGHALGLARVRTNAGDSMLPAPLGTNRRHTPVWSVAPYAVIFAAVILAAGGQEQELVLVCAVAVFVSFLAGLLAMARFWHRQGSRVLTPPTCSARSSLPSR